MGRASARSGSGGDQRRLTPPPPIGAGRAMAFGAAPVPALGMHVDTVTTPRTQRRPSHAACLHGHRTPSRCCSETRNPAPVALTEAGLMKLLAHRRCDDWSVQPCLTAGFAGRALEGVPFRGSRDNGRLERGDLGRLRPLAAGGVTSCGIGQQRLGAQHDLGRLPPRPDSCFLQQSSLLLLQVSRSQQRPCSMRSQKLHMDEAG